MSDSAEDLVQESCCPVSVHIQSYLRHSEKQVLVIYLGRNLKRHHGQPNRVSTLDIGIDFGLIMHQQRQPALLEQPPLPRLTQSTFSFKSNSLAFNFQLIHLKFIYMKHQPVKWVSRLEDGFCSSWPPCSHLPA